MNESFMEDGLPGPEYEAHVRRRDLTERACFGIPTAALEAAGEGGVAALVEALGFYMRLPDFESCNCDRCVYARTALAPFTADAPEGA